MYGDACCAASGPLPGPDWLIQVQALEKATLSSQKTHRQIDDDDESS